MRSQSPSQSFDPGRVVSKLAALVLSVVVLFSATGCSLLGIEDDNESEAERLLAALLLTLIINPCPTIRAEGVQGCGGLNLTGLVTTLAGSGTNGFTDATGTAAQFDNPFGLATDGTNVYVADTTNNRIRRIVIATGETTTLAGDGTAASVDGAGTAAQINAPNSIAITNGRLYVLGGFVIRQIEIATGVTTTLAGNGSNGFADGTGTAAQFGSASGITTDGSNLFVADRTNERIRQVAIATGVVTTLAGSGASGSADGVRTAATFSLPYDITTDGTNLYVADSNNHRIRKIEIASGVVTTLAGSSSGNTDGTGTAAQFAQPQGITSDGVNLYVAENTNHQIRKVVIETGAVTTLAGTGSTGAANGTGTAASFNAPRGLAVDQGSLYVGETGNDNVRRIQ